MDTEIENVKNNTINFSDVGLEKIIVHQVGNKLREEPLIISKHTLDLNHGPLIELLKRFFLSTFRDKDFYNFTHQADINLNEIFSFSTKIFQDPDCFFLQSINIAKHLYEKSTHPKVKGGEIYIVYFDNCLVGGDSTNAIGIFKSEHKDTFLKITSEDESFKINPEDGVNINKLDKGCIIFNLEKEKGFKICIVDSLNKSSEAQYWKDEFLQLKHHEDFHYHTKNYINLCQNFVAEKFKDDFEVGKIDQIDFMNRSMDFFNKKEVFDINEFADEVIHQPEIINSFNEYKKEFQETKNIQVFDEFNISTAAVKQSSKFYKSIIKLDKSFHIYVHGNKDNIEKGFDEDRGMSFYKIYYKNEQ